VLARHVEQRLDALLDRRRLAGERAQVHALGAGRDQRRQRLHPGRELALDLAAPLAEQAARLLRAPEQHDRHHRLGQRAQRRADLDAFEVVRGEMDPPDQVFQRRPVPGNESTPRLAAPGRT